MSLSSKVIEESKISPYMQGGQPSGFRIGKIPPQSILRKMGLRSRDVITGVDDTAIESSEHAAEVFKRISEGGVVTVTIKRRRLTRKIKLNIE